MGADTMFRHTPEESMKVKETQFCRNVIGYAIVTYEKENRSVFLYSM